MKYLVDTDICIYIINERPKRVLERFKAETPGDVAVSSVTVGELAFGVAKTKSQRNREALQAFLFPMEIVPFDAGVAMVYGEVRAELEVNGHPIGPLDTMIAAHARALGLILVTNNIREFSRVPSLVVENWAL
jgi:tRNA(fMet)-specific endonuclease VapC